MYALNMLIYIMFIKVMYLLYNMANLYSRID